MLVIRQSLGDYEKQVIHELDNELTLIESKPLVLRPMDKILLIIIADFYSRDRTTDECSAAILNLRLTILLVCPNEVREQRNKTYTLKQRCDREEPHP